MKKLKPIEWIKRYLPAEIAGTISALLSALIARGLGYHAIIIAYAGSIGESIGFYAAVFIQQIIVAQKARKQSNDGDSKVVLYGSIIAEILLEFGPAAVLDDLIVRPFFMYWFPILLNHFSIGILAGKIAGDICFYFSSY